MKLAKVVITVFMLVSALSHSAFAQLSDLHYLPPLKQESNNIGFQVQAIYLSTPETTEFDVKVYQGTDPTPIKTIKLSNLNPYIYSLGNGDNNVTFVDNDNTGKVLSDSGLRFESENGERFYVNHRGAQSAQGSSLTSKGRAALGKRFRWGGGPVIFGDDTNATLGIMATEDGTTVEISGYDPSIVFRKGSDVDAITDDRLSITLNKGQSYVLEYAIRNLPNFKTNITYDEWMGALIAADKDIAVSLGNALYSPSNDGGRDIAIDQIIPENVLGNEYVFVRGYGKDDLEFAIIIATQNGTELYVNDALTPITTIDAGEYYIVPGSYYSGSSTVRQGENMYVRASKQIYAYHSTAGANNGANVDYNFIAPVNFLLDKEVNFIPGVDQLATKTLSGGGVSIISAASTPDAELEVYENGVLQDLTGKRKVVSGSELWVTYFLDGLKGDVKVLSTNSIAVGFMGQSGVVGVSGYFSGFETIPSIDVDVNVVGDCLQDGNVSLSAPQGYSIYQWYLEGNPVSGATQSTLVPNLPGSYTIGITQSADGKEYVSAPVDVSDCLPEIKLDVTSTKQTPEVNESITLRVNYKYQSFFSASSAEVSLSIPSNFEITANNPSVGSWSNSTRKWTIGNVSPGDEEVLELTLKALSVGNPVTVSASNSQTVYGSDNTTLLNEGNNITDDLTEVFNIKNTTVISASSPISKTALDADFNLAATSNNPNPISYASSDEGVVRVASDGTVSIVSEGTAVITLSQLASSSYGPGTNTVTITVSKVTPTLSGFPDITKTFGDPNFQLTAPTSTGDGTFSYTSSNPSVATVNSSTGEVT
ncbi:IgGFc-binding protein, partial [Nonlabens sp.]|uniref:IgGFc-binding protein n=1 Tax=Nonlabens sp. TaxID=1888209 RepID=UPI00345D0794